MEIIDFLRKSVITDDVSVVIASHDERISEFSDRVLSIRDGVLTS